MNGDAFFALLVFIVIIISVIRNIVSRFGPAEGTVLSPDQEELNRRLRELIHENQADAALPLPKPTTTPMAPTGKAVSDPYERHEPAAPAPGRAVGPKRPPAVDPYRRPDSEKTSWSTERQNDPAAQEAAAREAAARDAAAHQAALRQAAKAIAARQEQVARQTPHQRPVAPAPARAHSPHPAASQAGTLDRESSRAGKRRVRRRTGLRLTPRTMAQVAILSEIWRQPVALRDKMIWERD